MTDDPAARQWPDLCRRINSAQKPDSPAPEREWNELGRLRPQLRHRHRPRPRPRRRSWAVVLAAASWVFVLSATAAPAGEGEALVISEGTVAHHHVLAIGRDLRVHGRAEKNASIVQGNAFVSGEIEGDLVVLGGDAHLLPSARVAGDIVVLGGRIEAAPQVEVGGRMTAYPDAPRSLLVLLEGPALGLSAWSPIVLGAKAALLATWLLAGLVLTGGFPNALASTAEEVRRAPLRSFFTGLVAVLAVTQIILFLVAFSSAVVGLPLAAGLVLAALTLKVWGTVAVLRCAGASLRARLAPGKRRDPVVMLATGLALLGAIKMLPWLGTVAWTAVTLVGMGAALASKLGARESWVDTA